VLAAGHALQFVQWAQLSQVLANTISPVVALIAALVQVFAQ